jgi:hypothetical protein
VRQSVCIGRKAVLRAERIHFARAAQGAARPADMSAEPDQPVVEVAPLLPGKRKTATISLCASVALVKIFLGSGSNPDMVAQVAAGTAKFMPSMPLAMATGLQL